MNEQHCRGDHTLAGSCSAARHGYVDAMLRTSLVHTSTDRIIARKLHCLYFQLCDSLERSISDM